jgi:hypothetical protein
MKGAAFGEPDAVQKGLQFGEDCGTLDDRDHRGFPTEKNGGSQRGIGHRRIGEEGIGRGTWIDGSGTAIRRRRGNSHRGVDDKNRFKMGETFGVFRSHVASWPLHSPPNFLRNTYRNELVSIDSIPFSEQGEKKDCGSLAFHD